MQSPKIYVCVCCTCFACQCLAASGECAMLQGRLGGKRRRSTEGENKHCLFVQKEEIYLLVWKEQVGMGGMKEGGSRNRSRRQACLTAQDTRFRKDVGCVNITIVQFPLNNCSLQWKSINIFLLKPIIAYPPILLFTSSPLFLFHLISPICFTDNETNSHVVFLHDIKLVLL